jgi:glycerol-3-phosphate O-acyltransferase
MSEWNEENSDLEQNAEIEEPPFEENEKICFNAQEDVFYGNQQIFNSRLDEYEKNMNCEYLSEEEREAEEAKSRKINMASMRAMDKCKREGKPILVFPAGTRYRPGNPETKKGVREIDSYLRMFDIMVFVSVNGSCLRISTDNPNDMLADQVHPDTVILSASPVMECKKFRNDILATLEDYEGDKKLVVVDKVMEELNKLHEQYRPEYERGYKETTGEEVDIDQG